jgi:hypothetical protein
MQQFQFIDPFNQLYMFRALTTPILRMLIERIDKLKL